MTTLTTVLGLAPLLYERSSQAQFLKPTVITLVYGLGFGMLLVLLMVPALVVVQHDVQRHLKSFRLAISGRSRFASAIMSILVLLVLDWFGTTMGWAILTNAMLPMFENSFATLSLAVRSLVIFLIGVGCLCLLAYVGTFTISIIRTLRAPNRQ